MSECKSCIGCKFLYESDDGYSNWTVTDTTIRCALDLNPLLKGKEVSKPYDWNEDADNDNLPQTQNGRCERFSPGTRICLDVEREGWGRKWSNGDVDPPQAHNAYPFDDEEQYTAIAQHDTAYRDDCAVLPYCKYPKEAGK